MKQNRILRLTALILCISWIFGCTGLRNPPVSKNYFDLKIQGPVSGSPAHLNQGSTLLIKEFLIAPEFDSHAFVYRLDNNQYANDFYNEFVSYPARLISDRIAEAMYTSKYFTRFLTRNKQDASFRLSGKITRLHGEMQKNNTARAIMEIRFVLEKKINHSFEKIFAKTFLAEENLTSPEADRLAAGWSRGLETIITDFLREIVEQAVMKGDSPA